MPTLNGIEFQIIEIEWSTYQNNVIQEVLNSDTVEVQNQGHGSDPVRIKGMVNNEKELDDFQEQFYSNGILTFIKDPASNKQYSVYALGSVKRESIRNLGLNSKIIFTCMIQLRYPYSESVDTITRSKSITTQNQEWSTDDDGNYLKTDGNVDAVPDIQVTGGTTQAGIIQTDSDSNYNLSNSLTTVNISNTASSGTEIISTSNRFGQTIKCRKAGMGILDYIQVDVQSVTVGGVVTCSVYNQEGGTLLGSQVLTISSTGVKTYTFATPIAIVQEEDSCNDTGTDASQIFIELTATGTTYILIHATSNSYADGTGYRDGSPVGWDMYFVANGHSIKEIRQTFTVSGTPLLTSIILSLCKYNYGGTNNTTVVIKEGSTTLGTGTAILTGTTFSNVTFSLSEATTGSLNLVANTTYTLIITPPSDSANATAILIKTKTTNVYDNGAVTLVENGGTARLQTHDLYFEIPYLYSNGNIELYNTADTTVKCTIANKVLNGAIYRINADGTGTIDYDDDFTTDKWDGDSTHLNITHDTINDELDIADNGYIYWQKDTKFSVDGTPTLTARIDITAGTPTIQISTNGTTWYDIDTAIVDDVETEYPLDSDGNLSLPGKTEFYFRIDCVKAAAATATIKYFELDINIHTIYAKNPKIAKGSSASTFRIDQDSDSGMACELALIYKHKWWV